MNKTSINKTLFFIVLLYALFFVFMSCRNTTAQNGNKQATEKKKPSPDPAPKPDPAPEPSADDIRFVKITPPTGYIIGQTPDCNFPEEDDYWKGVFIKKRRVKLTPYNMAETEVPYKLWKKVYDWSLEHGFVYANEGQKGGAFDDENDPYDASKHSEDEPVTMVSWRDCMIWCNAYTLMKNESVDECVYRISANNPFVIKDATQANLCDDIYADMTKTGYRLPTEAEWEFAARWQGENDANAKKYGSVHLTNLDSASGAKKPIGFEGVKKGTSSWEELKDETVKVAVFRKWFDGKNWNMLNPPSIKTSPVGSKQANMAGIKDMSGNAAEWCFDWFSTVEEGRVTDPQCTSGLIPIRIIRGGHWAGFSMHTAVGYRAGEPADGKSPYLGFRLVHR